MILNALAGLLFCASASADILFVDFNFSTREREAAARAAQERGEELIVIPVMPEDERLELSALRAEILALEDVLIAKNKEWMKLRSEIAIGKAPAGAELQARQLESEKAQLKAQKEQLENVYGPRKQRYKTDVLQSLQQAFRRQKDAGRKFTSLVISGHAGPEGFSGELGQFRLAPLTQYLGSQEAQTLGVKSVFLWGCYTATRQTLNHWSKAVPSLKLIAGFDDRSPLGTRKVSADLLVTLLIRDQKIQDKVAIPLTSEKQLAQTIKQFEEIWRNIRALGPSSVVMCAGGFYAKPSGEVEARGGVMECPAEVLRKVKSQQAIFKKYWDAVPGYADVPLETGSSPLREYYTSLRQQAHCRGVGELSEADSDRAIRLVYFKTVMANYGLFRKSQLRKLNSLLRQAKAGFVIPDLANPSTTRAQVLSVIKELEVFSDRYLADGLSERLSHSVQSFLNANWQVSEAAAQRARWMREELQQMLGTMDCVPFDWIEPATHIRQLSRPAECVRSEVDAATF